ncbi:MAG: hypothetical protein Q7O04_06915 [Candidatus Omnitrophota bacterium]|nr:hypothetical protein [Candidatus Omnitrophota bacterium]
MINLKLFVNNQGTKIRFFTTLFANIVKIGLGFIAGVIIARTLGVKEYGNYSFLLGSFASIITLLDMGMSEAFYTFLSQRRRGLKFYFYYLLWIGIEFIIAMTLIIFIFPDTWRNNVWLGHSKNMIALAFAASFSMNKLWETVVHAGESIRHTVIVQIHQIVIAVLYLCIVITMAFLHRLTIPNLFIIIIFTYLLSSFMLSRRLRDNLMTEESINLTEAINEFKIYCAPLVMYGVVSFLYSFADVWFLQKFGGAVQQGYFSIGLRFSAICLIGTTSILKVFWKEVAEANELGNKERLYYLYSKISRGLCFVGAAGACFLIPFSREILVLLLGGEYVAGWFCLAIMFLYPIHQSLGQINVSYLLATAQNKLYSRIGIILMMVSIFVSYFVLAPRSSAIPGLSSGSIGLALKMVIFQIIGVNIYGYFICKVWKWKFNFLYQFASIGLLLTASFAIKNGAGILSNILNIPFNPLFYVPFCLTFYILTVAFIIYIYPNICGLERKQVTNILGLLKR